MIKLFKLKHQKLWHAYDKTNRDQYGDDIGLADPDVPRPICRSSFARQRIENVELSNLSEANFYNRSICPSCVRDLYKAGRLDITEKK